MKLTTLSLFGLFLLSACSSSSDSIPLTADSLIDNGGESLVSTEVEISVVSDDDSTLVDIDEDSQTPNIAIESNANENASFIWNGEYIYNGGGSSVRLDTSIVPSTQRLSIGDSCSVSVSLHKNDIDDTTMHESAILSASQCPLCTLLNVYDIHTQSRLGVGTVHAFGDVRQTGTWYRSINTYWFKKSETSFGSFAVFRIECPGSPNGQPMIGEIEFTNINE